MHTKSILLSASLMTLATQGCSVDESPEPMQPAAPAQQMESSAVSPGVQFGEIVLTVEGFKGPEAVRYDPEQDVYFVSNFNGESSGDANGFVSRVSSDGNILELEFMTGTESYPFHGGRGSVVSGDSLFVVDAGGLHQFDKLSGEHRGFVDLSAFDPGFPNDIVVMPDGTFYVTDTGQSVLYRIADGAATIATETPFAANGVTINPATGRLILVPWSGSTDFIEWDPASGEFTTLGSASTGGNYDGVEVIDGAIVAASQTDESLHVMLDGSDRKAFDLPGRPADIGVDTRRMRIAVPYVARDAVDIVSIN